MVGHDHVINMNVSSVCATDGICATGLRCAGSLMCAECASNKTNEEE